MEGKFKMNFFSSVSGVDVKNIFFGEKIACWMCMLKHLILNNNPPIFIGAKL
jgi:hypothetical protein